MTTSGQELVAGRVPGERIATTVLVTASGNVTTTETEIHTVTAALVEGRTYRVRWTAAILSSTAADTGFVRIREDDETGTQLMIMRVVSPATGGAGSRYPAHIETEYTAVASGDKTFSGTLIRASGAGNLTVQAAATYPVLFYVDYLYG